MGLASVIQHSTQAPPFKKLEPLSHIHSHSHSHRLVSLLFEAPKRTRTRTRTKLVFSRTHLPSLSSSEAEEDTDKAYHEVENSSNIQVPSSIDTKENIQVCSALVFGISVGLKEGVGKASEFFAGYILEESLSVDNLFVFVLIFKYFKVPFMHQNRVLSYGIAGAIVFRLSLILLRTATIQRYEAVNLLLAVIILYSSIKLFSSDEDDTDLSNNFVVMTFFYDENRFITNQGGIWKATPLLLTVAVIELSAIAFAVDSIPAVFGVTRDPFIVFTSNLFAILGLRSLYALISEGMAELEYLQPSIAIVLAFIGCKMILDYFGWYSAVCCFFVLEPSVLAMPKSQTLCGGSCIN